MTQKSTPTLFTLPYLLLTVLFVVCIIIANLVEIKTVDMGIMKVTAGLAIFPLSYIINDCIVEVYGFRRARLAIWLGFAMSLLVAVMLHIAIRLPGSDEWAHQEAMEAVYGTVPRIMAASFIAFVSGSMANAYVMDRMKRAALSRNASADARAVSETPIAPTVSDAPWRFTRQFSLRAIVSTLWGEGIDSLIFFPVAFAGILPMPTIVSLIISQTLLKTAYEILILPVTICVVRRVKRSEQAHLATSTTIIGRY